MRDFRIENRPIGALTPQKRNPRTHDRKQIRQIAESIKLFGFTNPIIVDEADNVIAGHGRLEAAKLLGMAEVPTVRLGGLTPAQKHAYVIADNKLAENAGWDPELLRAELQYVTELDFSFDLGVIGFDTAELDLLLDTAPVDAKADAVPPQDPGPPVTQPGDLWRLGPHRLLCGDATQAASFAHLMNGEKAELIITDPPYNVPIDRHVCGLGSIKHAEFAMASGEMSEAEFISFLGTVFGHLVEWSVDGSIHYVFMDWRHTFEILTAGRATYTDLKNLCVWNKDNGGMGAFYRSKHELVFVFKRGRAPHINNFELGQHGRYRTNVWDYAGVNTLKAERLDELKMHPTVKPVGLIADAIKDCSNRGGIVLDCFAGSGTTLIAASKTGRKAYAMELAPNYVDTAVRRWQTFSGETAILEASGQTFSEVAEARQQILTPTEEVAS